jgi:hypothetical protein
MLVDEHGRTVVSSVGWVDQGSLWVFRAGARAVETLKISDAKYAVLVPGQQNHFSMVHHFDGANVEITVHDFDDPGRSLATARVTADGTSVTGDIASWEHVQKFYTAYFLRPPISGSILFRVLPAERRVDMQQVGWYNQNYDKGYQGVIGVTEIPGDNLLLFAVQRSSELVIYDWGSQEKVGSMQLAGRGGNPNPFYRRHANELWADDYDTLVKIDATSGGIVAASLIQSEAGAGRQFMGRFSFDRSETICIIARPFSGDVIGLDPSTFEIRYRCELGRQPLEAVVLPDNSIVARDWRSGSLLEGCLASV